MPALADLAAYFLIVLPVRLPLPDLAARPLLPSLQRVAYALELACPGVESWTQSSTLEIAWCRDQYRAVRDCPSLQHADELPPHEVCVQLHQFACARVQYLEGQQAVRIWPDLSELLRGARRCERYWEHAATATNPAGGARSRRQALAECWRMEGE